jgi:phenylacetate-coenzyme A ligase PaaK-like adenylate-forming protein
MPDWDRRTPSALAKLRNELVREQVRDVVAPYSPFYKERFAAAGLKPSTVSRVADLARLPAVGERDLCPDGDPAHAARLVVQAGEGGFALHAEGPALRRALRERLFDVDAYRRHVESDTRPTSYTYSGLGIRFPIASTRSDLDVITRAGARMWRVLGLSPSDVVVAALDFEPTPTRVALEYAALGARSPAFFPGSAPEQVAATLRLVPASVIAVPAGAAASLVDELADLGAPLDTVTTLLLLGAPDETEREAARQALAFAGRGSVVILAAHSPAAARVLWAECRESAVAGTPTGYHTYPDLDVVDLVDPESGEPAAAEGGGELVVTQLGLRGSALLRWRTGDLVGGIAPSTCPTCRRTVPRVGPVVRRGALVTAFEPTVGRPGHLDLRSIAGALAGRADLADWRVIVRTSVRHGTDEALVYVVPAMGTDEAELAVATARDLRVAAGRLPSQLVLASPMELASLNGAGLVPISPRISVRA